MDSHVHEAADSRVGVERVEEVSGLEVVSDLSEHERHRVGAVSGVSKLVAGVGDDFEATKSRSRGQLWVQRLERRGR